MNRLDYSIAERKLNEFGYSKDEAEKILNEMQDQYEEAKAMADDSGYDCDEDEE